MKNILLATFILISNLAFSQSSSQIGINLGGTFANVYGNEDVEENKPTLDFLAGIGYQFNFNKSFSIVANINYERKSFHRTDLTGRLNLDNPDDPMVFLVDLKINFTFIYVSIPILLRHHFGKNRDFFINYGPFLSFLSETKLKENGAKIEDDSKVFFQSLDAGVAFGVGKSFRINENNSINLEIRNNLGLTNINRVVISNEIQKVKTNSLNLIASWQFNL